MTDNALFSVLPLYDANLFAQERTVVNQGGTSSGKTYSIMQVLFTLGIEDAGSITTVVGQDVPNLKKGAYRDAKTILESSPSLQSWWPYINEGERIIKCINGSIIEFSSFKDAQDAKSGKRHYLFINEANGISYEIYWQLAIRTRKKIFIDYNPSARFWVHDELIGREGVETLYSWYKHNQFLTDEECRRIEGISDPELHKVYARGKTGKIEGLVLTNWDICDSLPEPKTWKVSCHGLDFGFTNDPSALEHVVQAHGITATKQ
jgi:phage terminase large subunit